MGEPCLDNSYAERVTYHLKKWYRIEIDRLSYLGQNEGPH